MSNFEEIDVNEYVVEVPLDDSQTPCFCSYNEADPESSCGFASSCVNRASFMECDVSTCPTGTHCLNRKFQQQHFANVEVFDAEHKGKGLRLISSVKKGSFILEYVGEVISQMELEERACEDKKHFYVMQLNKSCYIDATYKGNIARFINHSCDPNCEVQRWLVAGRYCMGVFALRNIEKNEEITFNYGFERFNGEPQPCFCNSRNCTGKIGVAKFTNDEDRIKYESKKVQELIDNFIENREVDDFVSACSKLTASELVKFVKAPRAFEAIRISLFLSSGDESTCNSLLATLFSIPVSYKTTLRDSGVLAALENLLELSPKAVELKNKWDLLPDKRGIGKNENCEEKEEAHEQNSSKRQCENDSKHESLQERFRKRGRLDDEPNEENSTEYTYNKNEDFTATDLKHQISQVIKGVLEMERMTVPQRTMFEEKLISKITIEEISRSKKLEPLKDQKLEKIKKYAMNYLVFKGVVDKTRKARH